MLGGEWWKLIWSKIELAELNNSISMCRWHGLDVVVKSARQSKGRACQLSELQHEGHVYEELQHLQGVCLPYVRCFYHTPKTLYLVIDRVEGHHPGQQPRGGTSSGLDLKSAADTITTSQRQNASEVSEHMMGMAGHDGNGLKSSCERPMLMQFICTCRPCD